MVSTTSEENREAAWSGRMEGELVVDEGERAETGGEEGEAGVEDKERWGCSH